MGLCLAHGCDCRRNERTQPFQVVIVPQYPSATLGGSHGSPVERINRGNSCAGYCQPNLILAEQRFRSMGLASAAAQECNYRAVRARIRIIVQPHQPLHRRCGSRLGAPKGEGVAGTPAWVESGNTFLQRGRTIPAAQAQRTAAWRMALLGMPAVAEPTAIHRALTRAETIRTPVAAEVAMAERRRGRRFLEYESEFWRKGRRSISGDH